VIADIVRKSGLDEKATLNAVRDGRYLPRLDKAGREGRQLGLTGIPLFIIENKYQIVGAQPIEVFRDLLDKMK
jgi:predicted DsbA family dithiol-disulfide isomerase